MPKEAQQEKSSEFAYLGQSDQIYVTWQVSRNARTLIEQPSQLFDSVMCFPSPNMLALGEPMIAMGVLGTPGHLLTGDPIATYNHSLIALTLLSAMGMYWLVREWSGSPAAGIAAGLLYAFHPGKLREIMHPYADDTVWAVLALLFARRLLARTLA